MLSVRSLQASLIVISVVLLAGIFFLGKNNPTALAPGDEDSDGDEPVEEIGSAEIGSDDDSDYESPEVRDEKITRFLSQREDNLSPDVKSHYDSLKKVLQENPEDSAEHLLELAVFFEKNLEREFAGYYYEQYARIENSEESWEKTGENYFKAQKVAQDTQVFNFLVEKSINAFSKVLEINPDNLDAKAEKAVAYFESDKDPVRGVGMLREVHQVDPEHKKTLYYLGMVNMRSGQYEQARERMEKLVELQPENAFNHYYLGQIYLNQGEFELAYEAAQNYKEHVNDPSLKRQADQLINKIEQSL